MTSQKLLAACTLASYVCVAILNIGAATINIRPEVCTNAVGESGTCMFVWQCIKQEGVQLGPCVDRFLVGACCRLPAEEDNLVPGASGHDDPSSPNKVKPASFSASPSTSTSPPSSSTTSTARPTVRPTVRPTARPTPSLMTTAPLTIGTSRPAIIEAIGSTFRPIVSGMSGQSAGEQIVITVNPSPADEVPSTTAAPEEDFSECGTTTPMVKGKVVGGTHSSFGEWPWQVSVRRSSFFGFASTHRCGGAILNTNWVATAGHCVDDLLKSNIRIRVGEYDFSTALEPLPHQERGVERKVVHPRYNFFTYENDLALLKLDAPIVLQPHVRPICLPPDSATEQALVGVNATVTGWGRLSEGGSLPTKLQQVQVPIISNEKCQKMFKTAGRQEVIPDIFLCAGYEDGGRDSCQGDSGGPLQTKGADGKWFLAGIISWGIGCAEPNMPGVCTRITKFKDWIVETIS